MANTVVDPRAMVIHFHHASIDKKSRASGKSHYIIGQISQKTKGIQLNKFFITKVFKYLNYDDFDLQFQLNLSILSLLIILQIKFGYLFLVLCQWLERQIFSHLVPGVQQKVTHTLTNLHLSAFTFMSLKTNVKRSKVQFMAIQRPIVVRKLLMVTNNYQTLKKQYLRGINL